MLIFGKEVQYPRKMISISITAYDFRYKVFLQRIGRSDAYLLCIVSCGKSL